MPGAHSPHDPPQPSPPHCLSSQFGVQAHSPSSLHAASPGHVPHDPPQPSLPHCLPSQSGVHWQ